MASKKDTLKKLTSKLQCSFEKNIIENGKDFVTETISKSSKYVDSGSSFFEDKKKKTKKAIDDTIMYTNKCISNAKQEINDLTDAGIQSICTFSNRVKKRKQEAEETINKYANETKEQINTTFDGISNSINEQLSNSSNVIENLAESYQKMAMSIGRSIDEELYKNLRNWRLTAEGFLIAKDNVVEQTCSSISTTFNRIDDKGFINFSRNEVWLIISTLLKLNIKELATPVAILRYLIGIHFESYESLKNNQNLKTYVRLASYVYGKKPKKLLPRGWNIVNQIPNVRFEDKETGLKSILFRKGYTSEYVYSFAGTQTIKDWGENAKQVVGLSSQYEQALDNAKRIKKYLSIDNLTYTGHSQGGGEAAMCAYCLGDKAITFNPAGMSVITKMKAHSKFSKNAKIDSYIYISDVLNIIQTLTDFIPFLSLTADGKPHYIYDNLPRRINIQEWHGMDGFLNYMDIKI